MSTTDEFVRQGVLSEYLLAREAITLFRTSLTDQLRAAVDHAFALEALPPTLEDRQFEPWLQPSNSKRDGLYEGASLHCRYAGRRFLISLHVWWNSPAGEAPVLAVRVAERIGRDDVAFPLSPPENHPEIKRMPLPRYERTHLYVDVQATLDITRDFEGLLRCVGNALRATQP